MSRGLLVFGVCGALALAGCGGSADSDSTSTASTSEATPAAGAVQSKQGTTQGEGSAKQEKGSGAQGGGPEKQGSGSAKEAPDTPNKHLHLVGVPPISSAPKAGSRHPAPGVKTVKGGDNSVQEYGVEADESQRTEAAIALQAYLNAKAEEDWSTACSLLAKRPMQQLEKVQRAAAEQGKDLNGCARTLALLKEAQAQAIQQAKITEVLSFRGEGEISGDPSFLIFVAPPSRTLYSMPMYLEGTWKVGLSRPAELPLG